MCIGFRLGYQLDLVVSFRNLLNLYYWAIIVCGLEDLVAVEIVLIFDNAMSGFLYKLFGTYSWKLVAVNVLDVIGIV